VTIQITNTGTPHRVARQSSELQGRDAIVRVILEDHRNGGPISRLPRRN
jgi:hypothetical protein